jgi:hypothetical protein
MDTYEMYEIRREYAPGLMLLMVYWPSISGDGSFGGSFHQYGCTNQAFLGLFIDNEAFD